MKQTDYDGSYTYSNVIVVDFEGPRFPSLNVSPNPSDGRTINVIITGLREQSSVPIQIYNLQGQKIYDQIHMVNTPGTLTQNIEFPAHLSGGLYIIRAGQTLQLTRKIIVE